MPSDTGLPPVEARARSWESERHGGGGTDHRRQCGGEDESRRVRAHRIDDIFACGDVAAAAAERLRQRALDHVDAVQGAFTRGDAGAGPPANAGRMDLVNVGHRAIAFREVADAVHRPDVAFYRVESLEHDQLRPLRSLCCQQFFQVADVVVAPDLLFHADTPNALNYRI